MTTSVHVAARAFLVLSAGAFLLGCPGSPATGTGGSAGDAGSPAPDGGTQVLPPDPSQVAPPLDLTIATDFAADVSFLFEGKTPIQTGVATGAIDLTRVGVLRGHVFARDGSALPGVEVSIAGHPEFGSTLSRIDGAYDIAVTGGTQITAAFLSAGMCPAQRQVQARALDYTTLPDVVLAPRDAASTVVSMDSGPQIARGSTSTDTSGSRTATLLFPTGVQASLKMSDGSTSPLSSMTVHATELTVGTSGPQAMPASLPPQSAYTYAVELAADEAIAAGATGVELSQPVAFYVENFLGFPVGGPVPSGYYDTTQGAWVASASGVIVEVLSTQGGLAALDVDGSGKAADASALAQIGITDEERTQLASLYKDGASLWRVPLSHFSFYDLNWAEDGGDSPLTPAVDPGDEDDPCEAGGASTIECQNQILGEDLPLVGVPFRLSYRSDRVPGRLARTTLRIPLTSQTDPLPPEVTVIHLTVDVAGQELRKDFAPATGLVYPFVWDGKDAYGRVLQGPQPVTVTVAYGSAGSYFLTSTFGDVADPTAAPLGPATREEVLGETTWQLTIGGWTALPESFGGWGLSVHHVYDPRSGRVWLGSGHRYTVGRSTGALGVGLVIKSIAGDGSPGSDGDGGPAGAAHLVDPKGLALLPDGSLIIADPGENRLRKIAPDGTISAFAGNGGTGSSGDGGPATAAHFDQVVAVAAGRDGRVFIAEPARIRVVDTSNVIHPFAGTGVLDATGDGGPATAAAVQPTDLAVGPDGSLYLRDVTSFTVRRVDTSGVIRTVAGGGTGTQENGLALDADLSESNGGLAVGPDGSIYVVASYNEVRRIAGGRIATVAGQMASGFGGDGTPAVNATLFYPEALALGADGSLYIADTGNNRVRVVGPDKTITTLAGDGMNGYFGDGGPPQIAEFNSLDAIAVTPDGRVFIADGENDAVREISRATASAYAGQFYVPSQDGREVWLFDAEGRHLKTLDAITGALRWQFQYDSTHLLVGVVDADGNTTQIARSSGQVTITGPYGQATKLGLDANGNIATVKDPAGETVTLVSSANGLLTSETDAIGNKKTFGYDPATGRLTSDVDAEGNATTLARTDQILGSYVVTKSTPLGRTTTYEVDTFGLATGYAALTQWIDTDPAGGVTQEQFAATEVSIAVPDGTTTLVQYTPDPRFGMDLPIVSTELQTPGGYEQDTSQTRTVVVQTPGAPLPIKSLTETDERTGGFGGYTTAYDGATRTFTRTSDAGLVTVATYDQKGHLTSLSPPGRAPISWTYDSHGRPTNATWGSRGATFSYDPGTGQLASVTNPLMQKTSFGYDAALRPTSVTRPDGKTAALAWYPNAWLQSTTPPGRTAHTFAYGANGLLSDYTPPAVQAGTNGTHYAWDADHALQKITRPDGVTVAFGYDSAGRPASVTPSNGGAVAFGYDPVTGHLTSAAGPDGESVALAWDGLLPTATRWSGPVAGNVTLGYVDWSLVASESVDGDGPVQYGYDPDFQLSVAGDFLILRDQATGLPAGGSLGAVEDTITYDASYGERASYEADAGAGALYSVTYTRDALGRIATLDETIQSDHHVWGYGYDSAGRLMTVTRDGAAWATYTYDANGNRLSRTDGAGNVTMGAYDAQDRQTSWGGATLAWGANGELQARTDATGTSTFAYDAFGNLTHAALAGGTAIDYVVDGGRRRVGKKVNGALVQGFLYRDALRVAAELDGSGHVVSRFVYGALPGAPAYMVKGGVEYRIVSDHLGSPRLVVSTVDGSVAERIDYDELGNVLSDTAPGFQPFGFAGGLHDQDTGLVRFGARDYDPATGRWTAKDPAGFRGRDTNLYAHVGGDPVNHVDRDGRDWGFFTIGVEFQLVGAGAGGVVSVGIYYDTETGSYGFYWVLAGGEATGLGGAFDEETGLYRSQADFEGVGGESGAGAGANVCIGANVSTDQPVDPDNPVGFAVDLGLGGGLYGYLLKSDTGTIPMNAAVQQAAEGPAFGALLGGM